MLREPGGKFGGVIIVILPSENKRLACQAGCHGTGIVLLCGLYKPNRFCFDLRPVVLRPMPLSLVLLQKADHLRAGLYNW